MPVPGMPYGRHAESGAGPSAAHKREIDFIESNPAPGPQGCDTCAYNPWKEQGWDGGESTQPMPPVAPMQPAEPEPQPSYNEPYQGSYYDQQPDYYSQPSDYYDQQPAQTDAYPPYEDTGNYEPYEEYPPQEPYADPPPDIPQPPSPPQGPPPQMPPQEPPRASEPWRMAVILCCIAGLLFCGVEIYRIAQDVMQSDAELKAYRQTYLKEHNVDFTRDAQAVALLPAGETYPPTATPAPVITPTPSPRIDIEDPLAAAMSSGGLDPNQTVAPSTPTPAGRTTLERYPENPLCVIREEIETLQEENEDIVGRLIIGDLMDEIVVQRNNTYYLNHNVWGESSSYSAVFADENLSFRSPPENILIFGRTSNEGRAFAPLKNYLTGGFAFAQRYAFLSFNSLYEEARYVIIAVIRADSSPSSADYFNYKKLTFATDVEMLQYVQSAKSRSLYDFNVPVAASDRLLTLVTLSDSSDQENLIIICRKLRDGESDGVIQTQ